MGTFKPATYVPTQWYSAEDKKNWAEAFVRFVEGGFRKNEFTDYIYDRLCQMFDFIAHYDRTNFFIARFSSPDAIAVTLKLIARNGCHGDPKFTWSDVEKDLQRWLKQEAILEKVTKAVDDEMERRERAELARLKTKYEG